MIEVFAPAKVNLTLQVGRPRADGLHPLQSVVAFADVGDHVQAAAADTLSLTLTGPFARDLAADEDNLVLRAARALAQAAGVEALAALTLEKRLPVASGIGGGSSDAAAALKACNGLWNLGWSESDLTAVAQGLGADVPICVAARGAYMTGAGEYFSPLALPPLNAVLVNPRTPLATADVYRAFDRAGLGGAFAVATAPKWQDCDAAITGIARVGNDLAAAARMLLPAIDEITKALSADTRATVVSLSGSGATMFALTESSEHAVSLAASLSSRHPEWWIVPTRLA